MQLTILIIESISNFLLIFLLVRSELKIIKGKKMLLEQREREQKLEKEFRESPLYYQKVGRVQRESKTEKEEALFDPVNLQNTLDFLMEYNPKRLEEIGSETNFEEIEKLDEDFFNKRKDSKNKALETLAMCMGLSVEELKKIRNFYLLPSDRIRRIIDVYLMKPDIDFAISYSASEEEVGWARKQVFAEMGELKEFPIKNKENSGSKID